MYFWLLLIMVYHYAPVSGLNAEISQLRKERHSTDNALNALKLSHAQLLEQFEKLSAQSLRQVSLEEHQGVLAEVQRWVIIDRWWETVCIETLSGYDFNSSVIKQFLTRRLVQELDETNKRELKSQEAQMRISDKDKHYLVKKLTGTSSKLHSL